MKKALLVLSFCILNLIALAQDRYYKKALKFSEKGEFALADSFYSMSLQNNPDKETFINRALVRQKLNNLIGYCIDLNSAKKRGDKDAEQLFWKNCGKRDTIFMLNNDKNALKSTYKYIVRKQILYNKTIEIEKYTDKDSLGISYRVINNDTLYLKGKDLKMPVFPGGEENLFYYLAKEINYPPHSRNSYLHGKVYVNFKVDKNGKLSDFNVIEKGYSELDNESVRVLSNMPAWKPAYYNEKNVDVEYIIPINFRLN